MDEINQIIDEFIDDRYQTLLRVVIQITWISKDLTGIIGVSIDKYNDEIKDLSSLDSIKDVGENMNEVIDYKNDVGEKIAIHFVKFISQEKLIKSGKNI